LIGFDGLTPFIALFVLLIGQGFYGKYWRRGDIDNVHEWALAGRKLGTALVFRFRKFNVLSTKLLVKQVVWAFYLNFILR
jgi:hypothetical protein